MMKIALTKRDVLIIVDVQNDFLPGGALPVPSGDKVVDPLNKYIKLFVKNDLPTIATRDWHPENHISFKSMGGPWPPHCIRNTWGASFPDNLIIPDDTIIISKAYKENVEAYSGFQDTNLNDILKTIGAKRLFIGGLATDYCVKATVLDALKYNYTVFLLLDAIQGVDVNPGDSERAIKEMLVEGAIGIIIEDISIL